MRSSYQFLRIIIITLFTFSTFSYAQDGGDDGVVTTDGGTDGGVWDGGNLDGGIDDGGGNWISGCTDPWASNYNPNANVLDYTCTYNDCAAFQNSSIIAQINPLYSCYQAAYYGGYTCEEVTAMGGDLCALVIECGFCENETGCSENQWECANGDCINASWFCDGSSEYGNATWGPDCSDGSDENFDTCCANGSYSDTICNPCEDEDEDGICDDNDDCVGTVDDCGVCNGNGASEECWNGEMVCDVDDCEEQPNTFEITLELLYPENEEHIEDYTNVNIRWDHEGTASNDVYVTVLFAYEYGGGLKTVARNILLDDGEVNIDLSTDATGQSLCDTDDPNCVETIYGKIKITASDGIEGNIAIAESESLIIGDPEGDIGINWLNEEDDMLTIDWGWRNDQSIIFQESAFAALSNYSRVRVYDEEGIFDGSCANADSLSSIELLTISITNNMEAQSYTLDCGVDFCFEGGERIPGYREGNNIYFYGTDQATGQSVQLYPITTDGSLATFNNGAVNIEDFSLTDNSDDTGGGSENLHCYYIFNEDECREDSDCWWTSDCGDQMLCLPNGVESDCSREQRDFDGFSIYNKITSIRDCNIVEGCTDLSAINYNENANQLDCSCYYNASDGCMDNTALNFNDTATTDNDNSCLYGTCVVGCMDDTACNYDPSSIVDNNGCLYGNACMTGCIDDGSCTAATCGYDSPLPGTSACNFDGSLADGWIDDGSCSYTVDDMSNDNHGWCPLETLTNVSINTYSDRIPAMQTNSNIKYRVWLLDAAQNEILKTFESSGVSVTVCEELDCNDEFGGPAYIDECGECITINNPCDDCSILVGDITGDGEINIVDIVSLLNIVLASSEVSPELFCVADFNGDGVVNVVDLVNLVNFVLQTD